MIIKVIKRGLRLQIAGILAVGEKTMRLSVKRQLKAGVKNNRESIDAFMAAAEAGKDADECFAAMEDHPELDAKKEMDEVVEEGKTELLRQTRHALSHAATCRKDPNAQAALDNLTVERVEIVEPAEGKGICCMCYESFDLHYIAGTDDLCMKHINPGFI